MITKKKIKWIWWFNLEGIKFKITKYHKED